MTAAPPTTDTIRQVPIASVYPADDNPRGKVALTSDEIIELAASIRSVGVLEPLIVTARSAGSGEFRIVAGHRRYAGAVLAKLQTVPVIVRELGDRARLEIMLIENLQRQDLTPLEEAATYLRLTELGLGQVELAKWIGRSQAHVSKRLSLLKLPAEARTAIGTGALPLADALELVQFAGKPAVIGGALRQLVEDAKRGGYRQPAARVAAQVEQHLEADAKRQKALDQLKAAKVRIIDVENRRTTYADLDPRYGLKITPAKHSTEPCHAAYVRSGEVHYICTEPSRHAAKSKGGDGKASKQAQAKASATRERNKALRAAAPARVKLLGQLVTGRYSKAEVLDFALRQLLQTTLDHANGPARIAGELLGVKAGEDGRPNFKPYLRGGEDRLLRLAYAVSLATGEHPFQQLTGRGYFDEEFSSHAARYFAHLKAAGYKPIKTELEQIKPSGWRGPFDGKAGA
jgi:ParB/RepB/Spo0J family partition protein